MVFKPEEGAEATVRITIMSTVGSTVSAVAELERKRGYISAHLH